MKLKKLECESFAGIKDKEVRFTDGLNIIYGENETGKSTLADLIFQLFFQSTKLDKRHDKEFIDLYFPKAAGNYVGDTIDGSVFFETENGEYKLQKEWVTRGNGSTRLRNPDGTRLTENEAVNSALANELKYGRGIYSELVFASQKRSAAILKAILDNETVLKKAGSPSTAKEELAAVLAKAVMESGGVEINKLEKAIGLKLASYEGNWDFSANRPKNRKGIDNPYKLGNGSIITAYYNKEYVRRNEENARSAEKEYEAKTEQLLRHEKLKEELEKKRDQFLRYRDLLGRYQLVKDTLGDKLNQIKILKDNCDKWPVYEEELKKAQSLKNALEDIDTVNKFNRVSDCRNEIAELQGQIAQIGEITDAELNDARDAERRINHYNALLTSMSLKARIKKLGTASIEVYSLATGRRLDIENESVEIKEAVKVVIPDIVEIELSPASIDTEVIIGKLRADEQILADILSLHKVKSYDELKNAKDKSSEYKKDVNRYRDIEKSLLLGTSFEELEEKRKRISDSQKSVDDVNRRIHALCGNESIEFFLGKIKNRIDSYVKLYGSKEELEHKIEESSNEIVDLETQQKEFSSIPEEYRMIDDLQEYENSLKSEMDNQDNKIDICKALRNEAEKALGDKSAEEYSEELIEREEEFQKCLNDYSHWKHIQEVFYQVKNSGSSHAIKEIEAKFKEYLSLITSEGIEMRSFDDKLNTNLISGSNKLTYSTLSEGTKDTIYLAFRLAMLEYLFPSGGGLAVFDDPFVDMDEKRVKQACSLISKYAEKNQVIFMTCDSKYQNLMEGNLIKA